MKAAIGLPLSWRWMRGDAPPGYEALRVDGICWVVDRSRGIEYAAKHEGNWYSIAEAVHRGWIRKRAGDSQGTNQ